jgi:hyperosmotically inducible periplasmic protein
MPIRNPHVPGNKAPDQMIVGRVRQALADSADVNVQSLTIQSVEGRVRLVGIVSSLHEKDAAGRIATGIVGAGSVENDLTVAMNRPLTDHEILRLVEEALGDYPPDDPTQVGVSSVENGVVRLNGRVQSLQIALGAADITSCVSGVKSIVNEIEIAAGAPFDDIKLGNKIMDALSDDPRIDPFSIRVHAEDGHVLIEGEVRDKQALEAAEELASAVPGVRKVINNLRMRQAA